MVETIRPCGIVGIQHGGQWMPLAVQLVGHGEGNIDVSVLAPQYLFGASHPLAVTVANLQLAEDVFSLGYPYELWFDLGELNAGFPVPLVKRELVSALFFRPGVHAA